MSVPGDCPASWLEYFDDWLVVDWGVFFWCGVAGFSILFFSCEYVLDGLLLGFSLFLWLFVFFWWVWSLCWLWLLSVVSV